MDPLLGGNEPGPESESWMRRYFKALAVAFALIAALFLTITQEGPNGGLTVFGQRQSRAAPSGVKPYDLTALRAFTVVLGRIKDHYVEPERIRPRQMLIAALNAVERTVAEVMVEESKNGKRVKVKVQDAVRAFDLSGVDSPWALSSRMKAIFRFLQPQLSRGTKIQDVEYAAINGMLTTLDPHSVLLKPEIYNEMKLSTRGEFGGLGIVISMIQGVLTVMNPMPGTPAYGSGIKSCDQILKIGEESTVNMTLSQAVSRLRGAPGSKVDLTIRRGAWKKGVRKEIVRAVIKVDSVSSRMLSKKVGYVKLSSFQGNSLTDLKEHIRKLKRKGMRGLVLDLRGNPGGLLDQAIKISDLFIDSGTLVSTVSHAGKQREEKRAKSEGTERDYPMAVLVSSGSASASEIVAGALKQLDRAVIIGTRTFGKGSVQVLYDNDDGSALKLTIAQYLTPGDVSIQSVGITPDILTSPMVVRKDFIRLRPQENKHVPREEDLREHLTHRNVRRDVKPGLTVRYLARNVDAEEIQDSEEEEHNVCLYPDRRCEPKNEQKFVEDFQIKLARDLVADSSTGRRGQMLGAAKKRGFFRQREEQEHRRVYAALGKLGVDWQADGRTNSRGKAGSAAVTGKVSAGPKLAVSLTGTKANACEKVKVKVSVRNVGRAPAHQLGAEMVSDNGLLSGHEFVFGRLAPGASRSWVIDLPVRDAPTRLDAVTLKFRDASNSDYPDHHFQMSINGVQRPTFAYGYQLLDDVEGNKDGRPQRGERLRLWVKVLNKGKGRALRTVTTLKNLSGPGVFIRKGRFVLGSMKPGEKRTTSFTFDVQPTYARPDFKLELKVYDDGLGEYVTDKLTFKIAPAGKSPKASGGTVTISAAKAAFRSSASDDAGLVGYAAKGASFKVLGRDAGWYRVQVDDRGRAAFVSDRLLSPGGPGDGRGFSSHWQVTPPKLTINLPNHYTHADKMRISGVASDETRVSDLFIFVRNPRAKVEGRKIYYRSNRHAKSPQSLPFAAEVPLWPGANYVTVFARENDEVQTSDMVVIFRKKKPRVAVKAGKEAASSSVR